MDSPSPISPTSHLPDTPHVEERYLEYFSIYVARNWYGLLK
jgi:hypothetical protein